MKKLIAAAVGLALVATTVSPAFALSDKDKGVIAGILGAVIVHEIVESNKDRRHNAPPPPPPRHRHEDRMRDHRPPPPMHGPGRHRDESRGQARENGHYSVAARAFHSFNISDRRRIQRELRSFGFYRGSIDGAFGPRTERAIEDVVRSYGPPGSSRSVIGMREVLMDLLNG